MVAMKEYMLLLYLLCSGNQTDYLLRWQLSVWAKYMRVSLTSTSHGIIFNYDKRQALSKNVGEEGEIGGGLAACGERWNDD